MYIHVHNVHIHIHIYIDIGMNMYVHIHIRIYSQILNVSLDQLGPMGWPVALDVHPKVQWSNGATELRTPWFLQISWSLMISSKMALGSTPFLAAVVDDRSGGQPCFVGKIEKDD